MSTIQVQEFFQIQPPELIDMLLTHPEDFLDDLLDDAVQKPPPSANTPKRPLLPHHKDTASKKKTKREWEVKLQSTQYTPFVVWDALMLIKPDEMKQKMLRWMYRAVEAHRACCDKRPVTPANTLPDDYTNMKQYFCHSIGQPNAPVVLWEALLKVQPIGARDDAIAWLNAVIESYRKIYMTHNDELVPLPQL